MDLDKLTLGDLKQIATLVAQLGLTTAPVPAEQQPHPFVGRFVLCRCSAAGVHAGELVSLDGDCAMLRNSRRLWAWKTPNGVALSGVAQYGVTTGSKLDTPNPEIVLIGVCEVIPCSETARDSITKF